MLFMTNFQNVLSSVKKKSVLVNPKTLISQLLNLLLEGLATSPPQNIRIINETRNNVVDCFSR